MIDSSELFVASIALALNRAKIPCILWGQYLLNVHGVPSTIGSIDFVIPDDCLKSGAKALTQLQSLKPCFDQEVCPMSSLMRPTPPPAFHLHIDASEVKVGLYVQSKTLWFLPPLDSSLSSRKIRLPPHFVLASDQTVLPTRRPGRGSGVFESEHHLVVVPRSHVLLEAFLRLYARDFEMRMGALAMPMIAYMELYVDEDGFLDASLIPEPLKTLYTELREGKTPVLQWSMALREALETLDEQQ
ncbi:MAG: hypothetical protein Q9165_001014 [Trypethelium subeluteriae]